MPLLENVISGTSHILKEMWQAKKQKKDMNPFETTVNPAYKEHIKTMEICSLQLEFFINLVN